MRFWQDSSARWQAICLVGVLVLLSGCSQSAPPATLEPLTALPPPTLTPAVVRDEAATRQPPVETADAAANTPTQAPDISYNGIGFDVPIALATAVEPQTIHLDPDQDPAVPSFDRFLFVDYPAAGGSQVARLEVYLAQPFADLNLDARAEIERLRGLLEERPPLDLQTPLPFLPLLPEPAQDAGVAEYLDFGAGAGIRYVTQLDQRDGDSPYIYTFQGLSADGKRYISAIFPLRAPRSSEESVAELSAMTLFEPDLLLLDRLLSSLSLPQDTLIGADTALSIEQPVRNALEIAGEKMMVSGLAAVEDGTVQLQLEMGGLVLVQTETEADGERRWQLTLPIPTDVSGRLMLVAETERGTVRQPLEVILPPEGMSLPFDLYQPRAADVAVAGYPLFFAGSLLEPAEGTLRLAVLVNDCRDQIAEQTVVLGSFGGAWNGYLLLPERVTGPACAIAYTGDVASGTLRLHVRPLEIVASSAEAAPRLTVGFSEESFFQAGEDGLIFGSAVGAGPAGVSVQLLAEDGTILAQQAVPVENGLWQAVFRLPEEIDLTPRLRITLLDEPDVWVEQAITVVR